MTYSFLELLIFFCLEFISHHTKEILYVNTNFMGNESWNTKMNLFLILMLKNLFFNVKLIKLIMNKFSQFHEHIFRSSRSHMFFKIAAIKNFAILRFKKKLQHRCFPVKSNHVMLTYWYIFLSKCWDSDFMPWVNLFLKNTPSKHSSWWRRLEDVFRLRLQKTS